MQGEVRRHPLGADGIIPSASKTLLPARLRFHRPPCQCSDAVVIILMPRAILTSLPLQQALERLQPLLHTFTN